MICQGDCSGLEELPHCANAAWACSGHSTSLLGPHSSETNLTLPEQWTRTCPEWRRVGLAWKQDHDSACLIRLEVLHPLLKQLTDQWTGIWNVLVFIVRRLGFGHRFGHFYSVWFKHSRMSSRCGDIFVSTRRVLFRMCWCRSCICSEPFNEERRLPVIGRLSCCKCSRRTSPKSFVRLLFRTVVAGRGCERGRTMMNDEQKFFYHVCIGAILPG